MPRLRLAALTLGFITSVVFANLASAANDQGLEITPIRIEFKTDPGKAVAGNIALRNITPNTLVARPQFSDFLAQGDNGQPRILDPKETSPYSLRAWIEAPTSVQIASGEQKTIPFTIRVPTTASPGGHYGIVRFTVEAASGSNPGVSLSASIGTLVLLDVSGNVVQKGSLEKLYVSHDGKRGRLFSSGPVTFTELIRNEGNIHFKPAGDVELFDTWGHKVTKYAINETSGNVLPASSRKFEQTVDNVKLFGRYTAKVSVRYGDGKSIAERRLTFWVIPFGLIVAILIGIILLILFFRQYNRYILRRARR